MRTSIPVDPDADTAREWAVNELAKREYTQTGQSWLESFWTWLGDVIDSISRVGDGFGSLGLPGVIALVVLGAGVVALIVWIVVGPLRRSRRRQTDSDIFGGDSRDSAALRSDADLAAASGDWRTALIHLFRAIVRHLDERGAIDVFPGMTAHEAAMESGLVLAAIASDLAVDADAFDDARYGRSNTTEDDYRHAERTFASVRAASRRRVATS